MYTAVQTAIYTDTKGDTHMYLTQKKIRELAEDPAVVRRISDFLCMDGREFFKEVQSHLSPEELEEYLQENPDERRFLL